MDEMCAVYSCARDTRRWLIVVFYSMLNVGAVSAFVVCHSNMNPEMSRREFLEKLSLELVSDHVSVRASLSNVLWYFPMPYIF
jgi:hypothetical protein